MKEESGSAEREHVKEGSGRAAHKTEGGGAAGLWMPMAWTTARSRRRQCTRVAEQSATDDGFGGKTRL